QKKNGSSGLLDKQKREALDDLSSWGIPAVKHEEWKYTRISSLFNKDTQWNLDGGSVVGVADIERYRLPGHEKANELVFVNGRFDLNLSKFISPGLQVLALENASEHSELIEKHFGH